MYETGVEIRQHDHVIGAWLFALCAMVFVMVVLGGLTRLTHSGLSMVEWKPVTGWLPPLGAAEWQETFDKYRRFPEYTKLNVGMTLAEFKTIFWLEFVHRLWGRLMGVAFVVPFAVFVFKGWVGRRLAAKLAVVFLLGALQGGLGWYMVRSGLVDRPDVSQYRLSAHLAAALAIYGYMLWLGLDLVLAERSGGSKWHRDARRLRRLAAAAAALVFVTVISGGFVAGLDAGFVYNTFPLMDGELVPEGLFEMSPFFVNFFENVTTVQFDHRLLALTVLTLVLVLWFSARGVPMTGRRRLAVHALAVAALGQVGLGISTLVLAVPVALAVLHQAGAVIVFSAALWTVHEFRPLA